MKRLIATLTILLGLCTWVAPEVEAQRENRQSSSSRSRRERAARPQRQTAQQRREATRAAQARRQAERRAARLQRAFNEAEPTAPVPQFLKAQTYGTDARPNLEAKYYVVFRSSSTCRHCHAILPQVIDAHAQMLASGIVDVIFDSYDGDLAATREYLEKNNAPFAAIHNPAMVKMPGGVHQYLLLPPAIYIVDAQGNRIASGPAASVLPDWRKHTIEREEAAQKAAEAPSQD